MKNEAEDLVEPVEDQPTPHLMTEATGQALLTTGFNQTCATWALVTTVAVSTVIDCTGTSGLERELRATKSAANSQNYKLDRINASLSSIHNVARSTNRHASSTATDINRVVRHVGSIDNDTSSIRNSANSIESDTNSLRSSANSMQRGLSSIKSDTTSLRSSAHSMRRDLDSIENDTDSIRDSANSIEHDVPKVEKAVKAVEALKP